MWSYTIRMKTLIQLSCNFILFVLLSMDLYAEHYIIATGSRGGNYNKTGWYIAGQYNKAFDDDFLVIESNGSNENIDLLKNNYADFAIVQRDVLLESLYNEKDGINNVEVIAPLFEETFLFYLNSEKALSIDKVRDRLKSNKLRIGFTSSKGYTYELYKLLFKYLGVSRANVEEVFGDYIKLENLLEEDKLDGVISFSLPIRALERNSHLHRVFLKREEALLLEDRIPNLFLTQSGLGEDTCSLGSWTFFVGLGNKLAEFENSGMLF